VARHLRDRKLQRALMHFFKLESYFAVREALIEAGRSDLIGNSCDWLIPAQPPKEALQARRKRARASLKADYCHAVPKPAGSVERKRGYRPHRKSQQRQRRRDEA